MLGGERGTRSRDTITFVRRVGGDADAATKRYRPGFSGHDNPFPPLCVGPGGSKLPARHPNELSKTAFRRVAADDWLGGFHGFCVAAVHGDLRNC
jgi:hypothetical protein